MVRLRRRPMPISWTMKLARMSVPVPVAVLAVRLVGRRACRAACLPALSASSRRRPATGRGRPCPASSSMTRLRIWSTMSSSWVAMTTVVPVRLMRSSSRMMPTLVCGSRLPVGSSAIRIIGRLTNARAMATRCCSPPESSSGWRFSLPLSPTRSSTSGTTLAIWCRGRPITSRAKATFSWHGLVVEQPEVLEDGADLPAQRRDLPAARAARGPCRRRAPGRWWRAPP